MCQNHVINEYLFNMQSSYPFAKQLSIPAGMAFNYKLLGKFNFRIVLFSGIIEVLFTILFCYILAVTLKHKPLWLPTISECGEMPPEKYFFRWGILVGGLLLVVEAVVLHTAKRSSDWVFVLGVIAGLGLTGVAAVASNEDLPLHMGEQQHQFC